MEHLMSGPSPAPSVLRIADLRPDQTFETILSPTAEDRAALASQLGIAAVKKLRFAVRLTPIGKADWQLTADLGATVVQDCVVTLAPVTTRIDEKVTRSYLANPPEAPTTDEAEMPEDETIEALPTLLDLTEVMAEALALTLPVYPRADGAELGAQSYTEPGAEPLTEETVKPFAALAELRTKMDEGDS